MTDTQIHNDSEYPIDPKDSSVSMAESLLERLAVNSLDSDYLVDRPNRPGIVAKFLSLLVAACFGVLVAVAAVQADNDRPATDLERQALIERIDTERQTVDARRSTVADLKLEISSLAGAVVPGAVNLTSLETSSGATRVQGQGVKLTARSGDGDTGTIDDVDLRLLVNGLWQAGAEGISINGQRLGSTSAIRWAGSAVTVNLKSLAEPYLVKAIGDKSDLANGWLKNPAGEYFQQRADDAGVAVTVEELDQVVLPAVPQARITPRHASVERQGNQ
jgi:uncharacterized protein YlxW (UPF0749 family)